MLSLIALATNDLIFKAHSCIERAALLAALPIKKLATDEIFALRGPTLAEAIAEDRRKGFIPIAV
jgi:aromatic-L-amino-acid decarboxylase